MSKIVKYITVLSSLSKLDDLVNEGINDGYQPFGSLIELDAVTNMGSIRFLQPMVKYEEVQPHPKEDDNA